MNESKRLKKKKKKTQNIKLNTKNCSTSLAEKDAATSASGHGRLALTRLGIILSGQELVTNYNPGKGDVERYPNIAPPSQQKEKKKKKRKS